MSTRRHFKLDATEFHQTTLEDRYKLAISAGDNTFRYTVTNKIFLKKNDDRSSSRIFYFEMQSNMQHHVANSTAFRTSKLLVYNAVVVKDDRPMS